MGDYAAILQTSYAELPKVKLLPGGSWLLGGRNAAYIEPKEDKSGKVLFFYKAREAMDDVSEAELEALGAEYDIAMNDLVHTIYIESDVDWEKKVIPFLKRHDGWTPGVNLVEGLKNFKSTVIVAYVGQKSFTDQSGEFRTENTVSNFVSPSAGQ